MPLEATMMVIDNSEYMRNGDYAPTRFDAMVDAVNIVFQTKTDSNPENSVGLMTLAGRGPEVLVTHTRELGQVIAGAHSAHTKIGGTGDISTAVNVAQLALKHRQNKNLRQRIVLFIGSPLEGPNDDEKNLIKLAKRLKKNNIAVDIIAFGDGIEEGETSVLKTFIDNVNNTDNSHYLSAPPDPRRLLSDVIISSPVLQSDRGDRDQALADLTGGAGASGSGAFEEYGGIDPSLDPELAMVLRMSMDEERARQRAQEQAAAAASGAASSTGAQPAAVTPVAPASQLAVPPTVKESIDEDEEAALQEALRLSQEQDVDMDDSGAKAATDAEDEEDMDEDEEAAIARAIEMSLQTDKKDKEK